MTKKELKNNMVVKLWNGHIRYISKCDPKSHKYEYLVSDNGCTYLSEYNDDLTSKIDSSRDIIAVYDTIWEKPESETRRLNPTVEMTIKEIEENLGIKNLKIIE